MSRAALDDRISYCRRELASLEATKTNCASCDRKVYDKPQCLMHGPIPVQYMSREDCPDWQFCNTPF